MSISAHNPYDEPEESSTLKWVAIFVLLSILAHLVIIAAIFLITRFMPVPKIKVPEPTTTTLTLLPPPPPTAAPQKKIFIPTNPQVNAPHKVQPVVSANDTELTSKSKTPRAPNAIMPDVEGKEHASQLNNSPNVQAPQKPEVAMTPPTPRQAKPEPPTPTHPNPAQGKQQPTTPPQPAKPLPPTPPKKAPPQVDANGFPILPPLNVPTLAPPNSAAQPLAPAPSQQQQAASVHGSLGRQGDNSPAAMATELGKYKQYVYSVVGSYWYPDIDQHFGTIGVGQVHIQFTIHSDGQISDVTILEGDNLQILKMISHSALVKPAPYKPFSEALIKELSEQQGGDGSSYTDDFTFSVY